MGCRESNPGFSWRAQPPLKQNPEGFFRQGLRNKSSPDLPGDIPEGEIPQGDRVSQPPLLPHPGAGTSKDNSVSKGRAECGFTYPIAEKLRIIFIPSPSKLFLGLLAPLFPPLASFVGTRSPIPRLSAAGWEFQAPAGP